MSSVKIAITIDSRSLERVDGLVTKKVFPNRSRAIQSAVVEKFARMERGRLASECAKLDPKFEKALAEEEAARVSFREIKVRPIWRIRRESGRCWWSVGSSGT